MSPTPVQARLSRGEAESLVMLSVLWRGAVPMDQLAPRLGLSTTVSVAVQRAYASLEAAGLVESDGERLALTEAGRGRLEGWV